MGIFSEYTGPAGERGYYSAADWNKLQNPEWASSQEEYDRFADQAAARAANREAAMSRAQEAIPFSYAVQGRGGTNPYFSLGGFSGHSGGGTSGLSGFASMSGPIGYETTTSGSTSGGGGGGGGGGGTTPDPEFNTDEKAEGGVILPVQHMQEGGMIQSPYADPMKGSYSAMPMPQTQINMGPMPQVQVDRGPMPQPAIGGLFEKLHTRFGQQMGQMQASPLKVYQNYLMQTYAAPEMQQQQQKVDQFLDLVDQAERAHFGAEESFGFGGGPMAQQYQQALPAPRGGPMPGSGVMGGGIASLMNG